MKNLYSILTVICLMAFGFSGQAQWSYNGEKIYYNGGNIGIGHTNPLGPLHINKNNPEFIVRNISGGSGAGFVLTDSPNNSRWKFKVSGNAFRIFNDVSGVNPLIFKDDVTASTALFMNANGLGIGNNDPEATLHVEGNIIADSIISDGKITTKEVEVKLDVWADYVFDEKYELRPLNEVEEFVSQNKHLPGIPSEQEIIQNGLSVGEMNRSLMEKVEELTLYVIDLQKQIDDLKKKNQ